VPASSIPERTGRGTAGRSRSTVRPGPGSRVATGCGAVAMVSTTYGNAPNGNPPRHRWPPARTAHRDPGAAGCRGLRPVGLLAVATPRPAPVDDPSMAPPGAVGYVVCPTAVTPVELATDNGRSPIELPISGSPVLGDFAIATSPDGQWAFVVTSDGVAPSSRPPRRPCPRPPPAPPPRLARHRSSRCRAGPERRDPHRSGHPAGGIAYPDPRRRRHPRHRGPADGRTVLAASGNSIVPIDAATRQVGTPLDLGAGRTIFGMALDPTDATLYALVAGAVIPVNTSNATAGAPIPTGLSVSSVYSQTASSSRGTAPPSTSWARVGPTSVAASSPSPHRPGPRGRHRIRPVRHRGPGGSGRDDRRFQPARGRCGQQLGQSGPAEQLFQPA